MIPNSKFNVFKGKSGKWRFNLRAKNHQIILVSEDYTCKRNVLRGVKSVIRNSEKLENFIEHSKLKKGNWFRKDKKYFYFNLISFQNKQVIGTSEMYKTRQGMKNGIMAVLFACRFAKTVIQK